MSNLTTLHIERYIITGKVCGHVDHSEAGYLSFLPPTLTQLSLPNNIVASPPPTFPHLLTSFKLGKHQEYLITELEASSWVQRGMEKCKNLSNLNLHDVLPRALMNFPSNLTVLDIDVSEFNTELKSLPQTLQRFTLKANFDKPLDNLPCELISML